MCTTTAVIQMNNSATLKLHFHLISNKMRKKDWKKYTLKQICSNYSTTQKIFQRDLPLNNLIIYLRPVVIQGHLYCVRVPFIKWMTCTWSMVLHRLARIFGRRQSSFPFIFGRRQLFCHDTYSHFIFHQAFF